MFVLLRATVSTTEEDDDEITALHWNICVVRLEVLIMEAASVPSRIVLMGTSKISLNERFSQVPMPKLRHGITQVRSYSSGGAEQSYREPVVNRRPLYVDDIELSNDLDAVDDSLEATTNYIEQVRIVPKRKLGIYQNPRFSRIPVRNRISFPQWRNRLNFGFVRKINIDRPRPFGSLRYASRNTRFTRNGFSRILWRTNNIPPRSRAFHGRGGRFIGGNLSSGSFNRAKRPVITREELDKELDEYMKKGKHPQIDVSDLK
uniref:Chromatin target of PRMT1 protein C-terminal domain-containing protein n=1 Tax=Setaria digitata TaxID=48799 RepID=A0A915PLJ2_9BILA